MSDEGSTPNSSNKSQDWPHPNYEIIHKLTMAMSIREKNEFFEGLRGLDFTASYPKNVHQLQAVIEKLNKIKFTEHEINDIEVPKLHGNISMMSEKKISYYSRDFWPCVQVLLNNKELMNTATWNFTEPLCDENGDRIYSEFTTGKYFEKLQKKLNSYKIDSKILLIIIAVDETHYNSKFENLCPVYLTLANIKLSQRNKMIAKQLIGFLPVLIGKKKLSKHESFVAFKRKV